MDIDFGVGVPHFHPTDINERKNTVLTIDVTDLPIFKNGAEYQVFTEHLLWVSMTFLK